jgi:hypothetical protein
VPHRRSRRFSLRRRPLRIRHLHPAQCVSPLLFPSVVLTRDDVQPTRKFRRCAGSERREEELVGLTRSTSLSSFFPFCSPSFHRAMLLLARYRRVRPCEKLTTCPPSSTFLTFPPPSTYPLSPTTSLYAEGKVCLSLLGTWNGAREENWMRKSPLPPPFFFFHSLCALTLVSLLPVTANKSTILQVLLSITSMILGSVFLLAIFSFCQC